jgi:hypothetical protein
MARFPPERATQVGSSTRGRTEEEQVGMKLNPARLPPSQQRLAVRPARCGQVRIFYVRVLGNRAARLNCFAWPVACDEQGLIDAIEEMGITTHPSVYAVRVGP